MKFEAEINLHVVQEDLPVRGNAVVSGDAAFDRQVEDDILERLDAGDVWAWANVCVEAEFRGLMGRAYLGCVSCLDEEEFKADAYYDQLVEEAVEELASLVASLQGCEIDTDMRRYIR